MPSINVDSTPFNSKLDSPVHIVDLPDQVVCVEFSPFEWSQNVLLIASPKVISVATIKFQVMSLQIVKLVKKLECMILTVFCVMFQEENESMPVKYELDIVQDFNVKGRVQALAISQETLLTSSPNVIQFTYASSNHKIYLCESGFKDTPEIKVTFSLIL